VTAGSLVLGTLALAGAIERRPIAAAWLGLICTLTDRLDGMLARLLDARSEFGTQLDSLADLVAFGVVPAAICYSFFIARPALGWADGAAAVALKSLAALYVVATAVRLARFNVEAQRRKFRHYLGVPSTMTAGIVLSGFLFAAKYAQPRFAAPEALDSWRVLGVSTDALLRWLPLQLALGAVGMLSPLRVPRLGRTARRVTDAALLALVVAGVAFGLSRRLPEYQVGGGVFYLLLSARYHLRTRGGAHDAGG
jgi:CDP-diacylglycerol--serine O-phosphatidyltransferase